MYESCAGHNVLFINGAQANRSYSAREIISSSLSHRIRTTIIIIITLFFVLYDDAFVNMEINS